MGLRHGTTNLLWLCLNSGAFVRYQTAMPSFRHSKLKILDTEPLKLFYFRAWPNLISWF